MAALKVIVMIFIQIYEDNFVSRNYEYRILKILKIYEVHFLNRKEIA